MRNLRFIFLAASLAVLSPIATYAQSISDLEALSPEDRRNYVESMSPDEREAMREKWRAERAAMSDEERDAVRAKRQQDKARRREKWQSMSDEERAAAREKMGNRKQGPQGKKRDPQDASAIAE